MHSATLERSTKQGAHAPRSPLVILLLLASTACAQGTRADYDRAASLGRRFADKVFRDQVRPQWSEDGKRLWYRVRTGPETGEYARVDAEAGKRESLFDADRLLEALSRQNLNPGAADRLNLENLQVADDFASLTFRRGGKWWKLDLASYALEATETPGRSTGAGLRRRGGPRASTRTGDETSVTFVNRTKGPVKLFWLDPEGERREYGTIAPDAERPQHTYAGHAWLVLDAQDRSLGSVEATEGESVVEITDRDGPEPEARPRRPGRRFGGDGRSPDDAWHVEIRDRNVWLMKADGSEARALTTDGTADDSYEGPFLWSPDSRFVVARRTIPGETRQVTLVESAPRDQLQPKVHTLDYTKPGDRMAVSHPALFDIGNQKLVAIENTLFATPWSLSDFRWKPDSTAFRFEYNQRGHQALRIVEVTAATGAVRALVDETSPTFIDYSGKRFVHWLEESDELIWMSERSGWNHLYLYDTNSGSVKNPVTQGEWVVRSVDRVDEENRQVWFRAGGIRPGQDPYYLHVCRVNFDGSGLTILTEGDGTHDVQFSPDGTYVIDRWSRVDQPPVTELRRTADGSLVCVLEQPDSARLIESGWKAPERFVAKARDGKTDIYGIIVRPTNFEAGKKYPVIEHIYAGPQSAFVPKSFRVTSDLQAMAELGFIVVKIDGMGTSHRSKAFHDVCWKNLGDSGFPDRILWMQAAAAKYPELDLSRVGIYGGSAGGQSALRALLAHGDFYKAAVADCGCHDNRMDKIWWNELWMGWPVGPHYAEQSNVTQAHRLLGKLLLTVGELDRNVDPASTMQVVSALIRANKDFDLLIVPGAGHGIGESPYASRRRADFFVRNLWGMEPRRE